MDKWIVYGSPHFSARELSVAPGATVRIQDPAPSGVLVVQGHGSINGLAAEAPGILRYGQMSADEFFITEAAAREGVSVTNASHNEPLVLLRHFGPGHPDAVEWIEK